MKYNIYDKVIEIRVFERTLLRLFGQNMLSGTTHTYIGEEATASAIMQYVCEKDSVFSNHRCHGHFLAYGGTARSLLAEIMSKKSGVCQGKGGSQHLHYKNFYTNGIQGGIVPNALGVAFAKKLNHERSKTICFIGDGTLGQGVVYEAVNVAVVKQIPMIFVVEDNQYAMSTKRRDAISGDIKNRFIGFGMEAREIESTNVDELSGFFKGIFHYVDQERKPICAVVHNYRLAAHSKGDDTRDSEEIETYKKKDPVLYIKSKIGEDEYDRKYKEFEQKFDDYVKELLEEESLQLSPAEMQKVQSGKTTYVLRESKRCLEEMRRGFAQACVENRDIVFLGEDICDPYGGAFKTTKGLSTSVPEQVHNMPISEACMVGMAVGLAMAGKIPVVEIMFGDFVTLGFDQLLNHAVKYGWVYDTPIPMIVRIPGGAKRGYGPTHSQSLEKYLMGIPMLRVLALSTAHNPVLLYDTVFHNISEPTIILENKKLYSERLMCVENGFYKDFEVEESNCYGYSTLKFSYDRSSQPDYCILTYGGMTGEALEASESMMMEHEQQVDVIVLSQISPFPIEDIKRLVQGNPVIVTVEEGTQTLGVGTEMIAQCMEYHLGSKYIRIASPDMPIPNGIVLEEQIVAGKQKIIDRLKEKC